MASDAIALAFGHVFMYFADVEKKGFGPKQAARRSEERGAGEDVRDELSELVQSIKARVEEHAIAVEDCRNLAREAVRPIVTLGVNAMTVLGRTPRPLRRPRFPRTPPVPRPPRFVVEPDQDANPYQDARTHAGAVVEYAILAALALAGGIMSYRASSSGAAPPPLQAADTTTSAYHDHGHDDTGVCPAAWMPKLPAQLPASLGEAAAVPPAPATSSSAAAFFLLVAIAAMAF
ncbi:hypothetical protein B0T24DRAFT_620150, partial [Lasiosphaeria ovina]